MKIAAYRLRLWRKYRFTILFSHQFSLVLYARISIAVYGKYRAALRHIACAFGANIDLQNIPSSTADATAVPLLHKDCSFGRNRAKVGCCPSLHQSIHSKLNNKTICGYGEIGRRFRLRFLWVTHFVWVRVPLSAP